MELEEAVAQLHKFGGEQLSDKLASLEASFRHQELNAIRDSCERHAVSSELLGAAFEVKSIAGQINVVIHAVGILTALPYILDPDEQIEDMSLGAGNTGRSFDLETSDRIAEFKFIQWQGGAESIRQNGLFKDFFHLAEAETTKSRELYLLELDRPLRFLSGRRALSSVMSRDRKLLEDFLTRYGDRFTVVRDYYEHRRQRVKLVDLRELAPEFATLCAS